MDTPMIEIFRIFVNPFGNLAAYDETETSPMRTCEQTHQEFQFRVAQSGHAHGVLSPYYHRRSPHVLAECSAVLSIYLLFANEDHGRGIGIPNEALTLRRVDRLTSINGSE